MSVNGNDGVEPKRANSGVWGLGNPVNSASLGRNNETSSSAEFQIQNEDFPALPGTASGPTDLASNAPPVNTFNQATELLASVGQLPERTKHSNETGIATDSSGEVWNIPPNMLADQYGMAGMLTYLRAVDDPAIVCLALGYDLSTLGIKYGNATRDIHTNFGGPWADTSVVAQHANEVPVEYMTNVHVKSILPPVSVNKISEDILFFLFYNCPGEMYQLAAAIELYNRDWRYHKVDKVWITRFHHTPPREQTTTYEKGRYNVFDHTTWRKIPKEMKLEYNLLEMTPIVPPNFFKEFARIPNQQAQPQKPSERL